MEAWSPRSCFAADLVPVSYTHLRAHETEELLLILKGDGAGSVEALEDALAKIDVGDEVDPVSYTHLTLPTIYSV